MPPLESYCPRTVLSGTRSVSTSSFMVSALVEVYLWLLPSPNEKWGTGERLFLRLMCQNHSIHSLVEELELLQEKICNRETYSASL